jgi:hypothetical protein
VPPKRTSIARCRWPQITRSTVRVPRDDRLELGRARQQADLVHVADQRLERRGWCIAMTTGRSRLASSSASSQPSRSASSAPALCIGTQVSIATRRSGPTSTANWIDAVEGPSPR